MNMRQLRPDRKTIGVKFFRKNDTTTYRKTTKAYKCFSEAGGDISKAIKLAGYAEHTTPSQIVKALKEEILEATQEFMASNAPKAAMAIASGIDDPVQLGLRDKMSAPKRC